MPEIAEVARIVSYIKKSLVGKTLSVVKAQEDANVFGKVGTSAAEFQKSLTGKKVLGAGQQGKYFWMIMSSPPHPVFHFGMTGWFHIRGKHTAYYRPKETEKAEEEVWPPKFWKFSVETDSDPKVEAAFTDPRRFARIRLVDCDGKDIRKTSPLKENGPDPVIDKEVLTEDWLLEKMGKRHVPVKAFMLDQANISGIGNWVGDEIMYQAKLHPEQYTDTFSANQVKQLHVSMRYVCQTAVDALADSSKFPEDWLFKHRWGKGKKDAATTLPNGAKITFLTVGGRTSCVVPSVQKKTGPVKADVNENGNVVDGDAGKVKKGKGKGVSAKRKAVSKEESEEDEEEEIDEEKVSPPKKKRAAASKKKVVKDEAEADEVAPPKKSRAKKPKIEDEEKTDVPAVTKKTSKKVKVEDVEQSGRRRSGRVSSGKQ
ncbi:related to formamidopyrimidine-DNA glycosylase [Rhynchosporium graminicola]|uniref:Related to formamidopyrimidine-DNA glycosylase n=1 Tax=Rhynchosporium graminicola TaxID=2792576 RepID=A0A1E1KEY9_9HELO|nr:related to formamidopyrimidine-DNA glycosylase [Rhynchosporium commune]